MRRLSIGAAWLLAACSLLIRLPAAIHADDGPTAKEWELIRKAESARVAVVKKIRPAVVAVFGNSRRGGGSGVLFDPAGYALTNHHVVAAAGVEGWAGLDDGKLYRWKLIGTDPGGDVAIIQLTGRKQFPFAPLGLSDDVRAGDWVLAIGNPFVLAEDYKPTVTLGIVSGVKRYQPGLGRNMLVYGNCIQVDSSINPGNSGGPLFNLKGEVVGINGRASFMERGRVNVGAGYAISMKQIRNFLPELLATKIARHGTLDARFGNRKDGVLCEAINLDSAAAEAGLQLGDKLLRFEGEPIRNANEVTNLISTLPEDWPVTLLVERDGKQHTIRVRLQPLDYGPAPKKRIESKPDPKKPDKKKPVVKTRVTGLNLANAGVVRNKAVNVEYATLLWNRWKNRPAAATKAERVFQIEDELFRKDRKVGEQRLTLSSTGRFRVEVTLDGVRRVMTGNANAATFQTGDAKSALSAAAARDAVVKDPFGLQACVLASRVSGGNSPTLFTGIELSAADKALDERSYRLMLTAGENQRDAFVWISQFDKQGRDSLRLLKTGVRKDGDLNRPSMTYSQWQAVDGVQLPFRRHVVSGMAETVDLEIRTRTARSLKAWPQNPQPNSP